MILILYAGSGLGHRVLAENYRRLLERRGHQVRIASVLATDGHTGTTALTRIYLRGLAQTPAVWRFLYHNWQRIPGVDWGRRSLLPLWFHNAAKLVRENAPSLILTTHPFATAVVSRLKRRGEVRAPLVAAFSDWHVQRFWLFDGVDRYLVPTALQLDSMGEAGARAAVTGFLTAPGYYQRAGKRDARAQLGLPPDKPLILVMGGGAGLGLERAVTALAGFHRPACAVVVCGSMHRKKEIERLLPPCAVEFRVMPFVETCPYFHAADLLFSKPGGLTMAEAFAGGLPVLPIAPLPGHEEENLRMLDRAGALLPATWSPESALAHPRTLWETASRARLLAGVETESVAAGAIESML